LHDEQPAGVAEPASCGEPFVEPCQRVAQRLLRTQRHCDTGRLVEIAEAFSPVGAE
jgi:hypothetical protein